MLIYFLRRLKIGFLKVSESCIFFHASVCINNLISSNCIFFECFYSNIFQKMYNIMDNHHLKFPIGEISLKDKNSPEEISSFILDVETFPSLLRKELENISEEKLDTPYRPDGWTVRQVVHHIADSHMNSIIRMKLTLTEDNPSIKPYYEDRWAMLPDYKLPVNDTLDLIEAIHKKMTVVMKNVKEEDLDRTYFHSEHQKTFKLAHLFHIYSWHGKHHLGHIQLVTSS